MRMKRAVSLALGCFTVGFVLICGVGLVFGNAPPSQPLMVGVDLPSGNGGETTPTSRPTTPLAVGPSPASDPSPAPSAAPSPTTEPTDPSPTPTPQPTPQSPSPTPTPPTPPPAPACGSGGSCSPAQVAAHGSVSDCWVVYANKVYNVTAFIPQHDGGTNVFTVACGHDVGSYLSGQSSAAGKQHKHSPAALNTLNSYYIADFQ